MSVIVVEATGSWREIGRAYGEELRDAIERAVAFYDGLVPMLGGTTAELHEQPGPYIEAARVHAPVRFAELEGMAVGANIRLEHAMLMNCVEELTNIDACTTAGKGRFLVHAEMWYAEQTEIGVLVAGPEDGPTVVAVSCVGFLTGVGANAARFAQGVQSADESRRPPRGRYVLTTISFIRLQGRRGSRQQRWEATWTRLAERSYSRRSGRESSTSSPKSHSRTKRPNSRTGDQHLADDEASDLYDDELRAGRIDDLRERLRAVERAEERLASGTYGLSIESGLPIPDERLEVEPTAERTVEEEAQRGPGRPPE